MKVTVLSPLSPASQKLRSILQERCRSDQLVIIDQSCNKIDIETTELSMANLLILDCLDIERLDWSA
ncbi:MAG: hypothetical protein KGK17_03755, partial [Betaproteobacteria bacterium]|nr:hypothetical protein [Betaproteobacteria bacterium]